MAQYAHTITLILGHTPWHTLTRSNTTSGHRGTRELTKAHYADTLLETQRVGDMEVVHIKE